MADENQTTTTTAIAMAFSGITPETVQQLLALLERGQSVAVSELSEIQPLLLPPQATSDDIAALTERKEQYVQKLAKCKMVYEKMSAKRKAFTDPIKERLMQIMTFENAIDPNKKDNDYARARRVIEDFDQQVLNYTKMQQQRAELEKKRAQYKIDLRTSVEKRLLEMMTGQEKNLTEGMVRWELSITLDNIAQKETSLRNATLALNPKRYEECFNTNFPMSPMLTADEHKALIEGFKKEFTYEAYNEKYLQMAAPIKNEYLAKLPDLKDRLEKEKGDAEAEKKRKEELDAQSKAKMAAIEAESAAKREAIEQNRDMAEMEAEFIQQGSTQDLPDQASKKVASFENDAMWLQPFLQVVSHVAISKPKSIRNSKGEYIPEIQKWLTAFESCHGGKTIPGLKMEDSAKTIIRKK